MRATLFYTCMCKCKSYTRDKSAKKMASSFPLNIATRATTQRNNAESVGNAVDNPVNLSECPSDLDSIGSDEPYHNPGVSLAAIKIEPGTATASLQVFIDDKGPSNLTDKDLTDYLDESEPSPNRVEHAVGVESISAIVQPPTTAGGNIACRASKACGARHGLPGLQHSPPPYQVSIYHRCLALHRSFINSN